MEEIIKKWWNESSFYYQKKFNIPVDDIYYGPFCPTEKELGLINVNKISNSKILEIGCGGGQCSIFLSKNGAICTGIDISENQIKYATKLAEQNAVKIKYHVGSAENLDIFNENEFDMVLSIFSFQFVNNLKKCLCDVSRVLKRGGKLIFSLDHPFYSVLSPYTLKVENIYNVSCLNETIKTEDIFKENEWHDGNSHRFVYYFRKVGDIYNSLVESKFNVENIIEPFSPRGRDPWSKIYGEKLAKYVSPTIIFVAKKQ